MNKKKGRGGKERERDRRKEGRESSSRYSGSTAVAATDGEGRNGREWRD